MFSAGDALGDMVGRLNRGGGGPPPAENDPRRALFEAAAARCWNALGDRRDLAAFRRAMRVTNGYAEEAYALARRVDTQGSVKNACGIGCTYCCHQRVSASSYEVAAILLDLGDLPRDRREAVFQRIRDIVPRTANLDDQAFRAAHHACPLLDPDGRCAAYASRPHGCRAYLSRDREVCRWIFDHPQEAEAKRQANALPPVFDDAARFAYDAALHGAVAAFHRAGLPYEHLELGRALALAVDQPDILVRWLTGEPVFTPARIG
ncbi:MAG: YkgJ family cysteine cluster protein [Alphaproteobacteria bacterium]|nr:YkgJ family cysteine cluster protein [Alphaproteobacteria bacterium]